MGAHCLRGEVEPSHRRGRGGVWPLTPHLPAEESLGDLLPRKSGCWMPAEAKAGDRAERQSLWEGGAATWKAALDPPPPHLLAVLCGCSLEKDAPGSSVSSQKPGMGGQTPFFSQSFHPPSSIV